MNMERPTGAGGFEDDARPTVPLPSSGLPAGIIAGGCIAAAILLFLTLNHQRLAREKPSVANPPQVAITAPPPLSIPTTASGAQMPAEQPVSPAPTATQAPQIGNFQRDALRPRIVHPIIMEQWPPPQPAAVPQDTPETPARLEPRAVPPPLPIPSFNGPAIVQDSGESRQWSGRPNLSASPQASSADAQAAQSDGKSSARATPRPIGDVAQVIATGTLIEAVLETAVDSSRPGMIRAIVSKPVRSFDGSRTLIPRGARLVGEMKGEVEGGNRLLIEWRQLILPSGAALDIDSPSADASGEAGLDAKAHGGLGRFVSGLLQSAVSIGAAAVGARGAPVYYAYPLAGGTAQFVPDSRGGRRLTVAAGAQINVVVARTLDFNGSGERP